MQDLTVGVLILFAEAQALARDITAEKEGNVRAAYLRVKQADNAARWTDLKANPVKRAARNKRKKQLYDPAKRKAYYTRSGK